MPLNTRLPASITVTREITGRLLLQILPTGEFQLYNQDKTASLRVAPFQLQRASSVTFKFAALSVDHGITLSIQPLNWPVGCTGQHLITLGLVDFDYLGGTNYMAYPQAARYLPIIVTLRRDLTGNTSFTAEVTDVDNPAVRERTCTEIPVPEGAAYTLAFIAHSETRLRDGVQTVLPGGGTVTFTTTDAVIAAAFPAQIAIPTPIPV